MSRSDWSAQLGIEGPSRGGNAIVLFIQVIFTKVISVGVCDFQSRLLQLAGQCQKMASILRSVDKNLSLQFTF